MKLFLLTFQLSIYRFYFRAHTALPENIIVYRDGVGAGDIARLKETEIAALRVNRPKYNNLSVKYLQYTPSFIGGVRRRSGKSSESSRI